MDVDRFILRVTLTALAPVLLAAAIAGHVWGAPGVAGIVGAAGLAVLDFRWLARGAARATASDGTGGALLRLGARHLAAIGVLGGLVASGWGHPIAVVLGLTVLPPVLVAHGLARGGR
jgi:hypothetical protein